MTAKKSFSFGQRSAGVLMHMTSLPGPYGMGGMGKDAERWIDHLQDHNQTWWQCLPVGPIGQGFSPYASDSAFAGEPHLVGPDVLYREGLLTRSQLKACQLPNKTIVEFRKTLRTRDVALKLAYGAATKKGLLKRAAFRAFAKREKYWLRDYCLFRVLVAKHRGCEWPEWDPALRSRDPKALKTFEQQFQEDIDYVAFGQYMFDKTWKAMRAYGAKRGVHLIGDLPIFVAHGSADCWAHASLFQLDRQGSPKVVSGCPPDAFAKNGQLWGHALYDWRSMEQEKFRWWLNRLKRSMDLFDSIRLDHFIGFYRYWAVPASAKTARNGKWQRSKGSELFATAKRKFPNLALFAEDLGPVIPPVRDLRDNFDFAGMKLLQFGFASDNEALHHRPHLMPESSVVYPGTHDNDTCLGWYQGMVRGAKGQGKATAAAKAHLARVKGYFPATGPKTIAADMIRAAHHSIAHTSMIPVQDVLNLGTKARMNIPGTGTGNWKWRMEDYQFDAKGWEQLAALTTASDRIPL